MLAWISANLATIIGALLVAALFIGVCYKMYRDNRAGKHSCSCGGGCSGCLNSGYCCTPTDSRERHGI